MTKDDIQLSHELQKLRAEFLERWEKNIFNSTSADDFINYRTLGSGTYGKVVG